ncbi:uncharacterized protein [Rutidosis leptorrhynchoides]|uniref:uncharacterized protein n=1 Tax=Rutidosis leptorrhynchoides TaxID=125765 RepID=UPI003A9913AA
MALPQIIPYSPPHFTNKLNPNQFLLNPNCKTQTHTFSFSLISNFTPINRHRYRHCHRITSVRCSGEKQDNNSNDVVELPLFPLPLVLFPGQERFRVTKIVRTKPYLVAEVVWLEDRPSSNENGDDMEGLAVEVENHMKDVIRLSNRLNGKPEKEAGDLRRNLFPTPFSFFVGSTFEGAPREQQALLELEDTMVRLKREKETLRNTLNYLSAASAVKDVFPSSSS